MEISIVVPAYNEEKRIVSFLKRLLDFAGNKNGFEIIFVDDGSTDNTLKLIRDYCKGYDNTRIISYKVNKGKGGAVREGVMHSRGKKVLFIDSDGSIDPKQILQMSKHLDKYDAVVGTRASSRSKVSQPLFRKVIGICFNVYTNFLFGLSIRDKLCGFKGFKRDVAHVIFRDLVSMKFVFDIELFYRIKIYGFSLYQQPIKWVHKWNSKIKPIDPFKMVFELVDLRIKLMKVKKHD